MTIKSKLLGGIAAASLALATGLSPAPMLGVTAAQAQSVSVDFNLFFDELQPHGVWVSHPQYRYVWCPSGVDASWAPYTAGRWLYLADYGWYFTSEEPFAWAVYHYGRWFDDDRLGWCWVPGTTWAPAWVTWRRSDDFIGWAPLRPEDDGFQVSVQVSSDEVPEDYWFFVPVVAFVEPDLRVEIIFGEDEPEFFEQTEFLGPVIVENNVVVNNVIEVNFIEQQINQEIIVYETAELEEPAAATVDLEANTVQIFAPQIEEPTEEAAPAEALEPEEAAAQIEAGADASAEGEQPAEGEESAAPVEGEQLVEGEEPAAPAEDEEPAAPVEGEQPAEGEEPVAPTEGEQPAEAGAEVGAEAGVEAGAEAGAEPAAGEEPLCPAEVMVDGVCPPEFTQGEGAEQAAPAEEPAAPAGEPAPAQEPIAPAEEPAPIEEPAAPAEEPDPVEQPAASAEEPAPAEEPAAPEEAVPTQEPAEGAVPGCPPEVVVNGQCQCPPETIVDGQCPAGEITPEAPAQ